MLMKLLFCFRLICSRRLIEGDPKFAQFVSYNGVHMLCSPLLRSTVAMTTRREIKVYHFNKYDRIGLEVEMVDKKVCMHDYN